MNHRIWNDGRGSLFSRELECSGQRSGPGRRRRVDHAATAQPSSEEIGGVSSVAGSDSGETSQAEGPAVFS
jgi:hypothetical protein